MSKIIDSLVQATLDSREFSGVLLAKLDFTPNLRYNNSYQTIYWDEAGTGEEEYLGVGNLGAISVLTETSELGSQSIQLSLSGIPATSITDVFSTEYIGKPCYLWYAVLDTDTYAVQSGQNGPILVFAGRMDFADIQFGDTCEITVNATSRLADWERQRGGRFNQSYQQRRIDPTDNAFNYVQGIQNKPLIWGAIGIGDLSSTYSDSYRPQCFAAGTKFVMEDNSIKAIEDIVPEDRMLYGDLVLGVHKGAGRLQDWYTYKGIKVSGYHLVLEDEWISVMDSKDATPAEKEDISYSVTNAGNVLIAENGVVFNDFEMVPGGSVPHNIYRYEAKKYLNSLEINEELRKLKL